MSDKIVHDIKTMNPVGKGPDGWKGTWTGTINPTPYETWAYLYASTPESFGFRGSNRVERKKR
jgi:hypothetical protein